MGPPSRGPDSADSDEASTESDEASTMSPEGFYVRQVATMLGVSTFLIRTWEAEGLITPARTKGGYRVFTPADVSRLRRIRDLREKGINASGVRQVLGEQGEAVRTAPHDGEGVGARLRLLRTAARLSLRDVADATGLSPSYLSSVERSLSSPSIASLQKIAAALDTNIPGVLGGGDQDTGEVVVRARDRKVLQPREDGVTLHRLGVNETMLEPLLFTIEPGAGSAEAYEHDGEEFIVVQEGTFSITLDHVETHLLQVGDSITFRSRRPHTWSNPGTTPTVLVWVNTPPTF